MSVLLPPAAAGRWFSTEIYAFCPDCPSTTPEYATIRAADRDEAFERPSLCSNWWLGVFGASAKVRGGSFSRLGRPKAFLGLELLFLADQRYV